MRYRDRTDAGRVLGGMLEEYRRKEPLIIALPNGGVPVALEIAKILDADFSMLLVSKITPGFNSETGYGSLSEYGVINLNDSLIERFRLTGEDVERDIEKTRRKIEKRLASYSILKKRPSLEGRSVVLVDDGIASGFTMINAAETVRKEGTSETLIAVPTSPASSYEKLLVYADRIICPDIRDVAAFAVADAYDRWYDIDNDEARSFLIQYGIIDEDEK